VRKRIPVVEKAKDHFSWNPEMKLKNSLEVCIDNYIDKR